VCGVFFVSLRAKRSNPGATTAPTHRILTRQRQHLAVRPSKLLAQGLARPQQRRHHSRLPVSVNLRSSAPGLPAELWIGRGAGRYRRYIPEAPAPPLPPPSEPGAGADMLPCCGAGRDAGEQPISASIPAMHISRITSVSPAAASTASA
jgi:hypothetical protein